MSAAAILLASAILASAPQEEAVAPKAGTYSSNERAKDGKVRAEWVLTLKEAALGQFEVTGTMTKTFEFLNPGDEPDFNVSGTLTKSGKLNAIYYHGTNKNLGYKVDGKWLTSEGGGILISLGGNEYVLCKTEGNLAGKWKAIVKDPYASYTNEWTITAAGENKWKVKHKMLETNHEYNKRLIGQEFSDITLTTSKSDIEFLRTGGDGNPDNQGSFRQTAKGFFMTDTISMEGQHDGSELDHPFSVRATRMAWAPPKEK